MKKMTLSIADRHLPQVKMKQALAAIITLTQRPLIKLHRMPKTDMADMTQYDGKQMNIMSAKG